MRNILSELWHNIKSGVLVDLILIAQLALFFWISATISGYYLDIAPTFNSNNFREDAAYYSMFYMPADEEEYGEMANASGDPEYVANLDNAYRELQEELGEHYIAIRYADLKLDYEELRRAFSEEELLDFCASSSYSGYYDPSRVSLQDVMQMYGIGSIKQVFEGQISRINPTVISHFGLRAKEGRVFAEDDFLFRRGQKEIPVLLGSAFGGKYRPGDTLHGYLYTGMFDLKVVGILEEGTAIATDQILEKDGRPNTLDHSVVFPYFVIEDIPETEEEKMFAQFNYEEALMGTITADLDTPRSQINGIGKRINNIYVRNGLFPISLVGSSYGVQLFKQESEQTMRIFLAAGIVMGLMGIFGICMSMITKINANMQRYAIEIMNGQSIFTLAAAFLAEIVLIVAAGMLCTIWLMADSLLFLAVIVALAVCCLLAVAMIVIRKLWKIDIEEMIRSEE